MCEADAEIERGVSCSRIKRKCVRHMIYIFLAHVRATSYMFAIVPKINLQI